MENGNKLQAVWVGVREIEMENLNGSRKLLILQHALAKNWILQVLEEERKITKKVTDDDFFYYFFLGNIGEKRNETHLGWNVKKEAGHNT